MLLTETMSEGIESDTAGCIPTNITEIQSVFANHYDYFENKSGEIAFQQQTGENEIQREYSGRVIFELLQNAIDRAVSTVQVQLLECTGCDYEYTLLVANDGQPVTLDSDYNYESPPDCDEGRHQRPDFNALCSLHTSNKSPDKSIGTKGIGFRSVFSVDSYVRIWSRFEDKREWWGIEMHSPLNQSIWNRRRTDSDIRRGVETLLSGRNSPPVLDGPDRPSYHFPLPLYSEADPLATLEGEAVSTAIVVPVPEDRVQTLINSIEEFRTRHLYFTGLTPDSRNITVQFSTPEQSYSRTTWPSVGRAKTDGTIDSTGEGDSHIGAEWSLAHWNSRALSERAQRADLEVSEPGVAIALPPVHELHSSTDGSERDSGVYGYLPTLIEGPFGIDIHGDFQLSIDRTNLRLDDDVMGPYNSTLLQIAAEIHLLEVFRSTGIGGDGDSIDWEFIDPGTVDHTPDMSVVGARDDFWYFLDPDQSNSKAADIVVDQISSLLFSGSRADLGKYELWAELASTYFEQREEWPIETYRSFWSASVGWMDYIAPTKTRQVRWSEVATAFCDALRETEAPVAPIVEETDPDLTKLVGAVPLPTQGESVGTGREPRRNTRELFLRTADDQHLTLPEALKAKNRAVTTYDFVGSLSQGSSNPLGVTKFNRWSVLSELQQLPNSLTGWSHESLTGDDEIGGERAAELQRELIQFAAELYVLDTRGSQQTPADSNAYRTGWRVATDFSDSARRAGRALATLFLPTVDGKWEPARQLTLDRVSQKRLGPLPNGLDCEAFLEFLGVAPEPPDEGMPLTLVEGGPEGRVDPVEIPPRLTPPGRGRSDASLGDPPPAHEPCGEPVAWLLSLEAAWGSWLGRLIRLETELDELDEGTVRTNLVSQLGSRAWVPVAADDIDGVAQPFGLEDIPVAVTPRDITFRSRQQNLLPRVLWTLETNSASDTRLELLTHLGAIASIERETLQNAQAEPAFRILEQLQQLTLDRIQEEPRTQKALVQLFDRVLNAIVRMDEKPTESRRLNLLSYASPETHTEASLFDRQLVWKSLEEDAWLPADNQDQDTLRRFFPTEPLVAATVLPQVLSGYEPLSERGTEIEKVVHPNPEEGERDEVATRIEERLSTVVPELLALAESTNQVDIDPADATARWDPDAFRHVENVWLELRAKLGAETRSTSRFEASSGDVLLTDDEPPSVLFDTTDGGVAPPMGEFGEPVAELLLEAQGAEVDSLFARALQAYETDPADLQRLIDRKGAASLVETYEQGFETLSSKEREALIDATKRALNDLGLTLAEGSVTQLRNLSPEDIDATGTHNEVTEEIINERFESLKLPETRDWEWFRPRFKCEEQNRRQWEAWFEKHQSGLIPYLLDQLESAGIDDMGEAGVATRLEMYVKSAGTQRLGFDPARAVIEWLDRVGGTESTPTDPEELTDEIRAYSTRFTPVRRIVSPEEAQISRRPLGEPKSNNEEHGTVDEGEETKKRRAQLAVGNEAESAALDSVWNTTVECLNGIESGDIVETVRGTPVETVVDALELLYWPLPSGGVTEEHLAKAHREFESTGRFEALRSGLHISSVWDGAGYDLLGIGCDSNGRLQPVRYEIKAITDRRSASVHLSTNQLATYKEITSEDDESIDATGDWRLLGVESDGTAIELTEWLSELPEESLQELRNEGFDHDGLVIHLSSE